LLDSESAADVSVEVGEIRLLEIVKESKVWEGVGLGLLSGAVIGVLAGYLSGDDPPIMVRGFGPPMTGAPLLTADEKALAGGIVCGIAGGALGGIGGTIVGADKTIQMERKSDVEIKEILQELRKKARVRNFQ
jgi:outer membrane lipoprotein SlyB